MNNLPQSGGGPRNRPAFFVRKNLNDPGEGPFWDYSRFGWYFITICTQHKEHYFGEIVDDEIQLNEIGKIVNDELLKTAQIRENVQLDEFIVIPNHVHVIIIINPHHNVETTRWVVSKPKKR